MARLGTRQLAQVFRRAGQSLKAGVDVRTVWEQEARRGPYRQRAILDRIAARVAAGGSVADAMRDSGGAFPPLACELVDVGERTGRADQAFLRLADHYDRAIRTRRILLYGIAWPLFELSIAVLVVGFLIWFGGAIAPMRRGEPVDLLGFGLIGSRGLLIYLTLVASLGLLIGIPAAAVLQGRVPPQVMRLAIRIPGLGQWLEAVALERLAWSLAMAIEAGMDARRSVRLALRSAQNPLYTAHLEEVERMIAAGSELHESLRRARALPESFLDELGAAETAGTESETLTRLAGQYQDRAKAASTVVAIATAVLVFGAVALILITLIFRLAMFYIGTLYDAMKPI